MVSVQADFIEACSCQLVRKELKIKQGNREQKVKWEGNSEQAEEDGACSTA